MGRAALIAGLVLTVITIIAKLQAIGRLLSRFGAWVGRTLIWALIHSDSEKSREALGKLLDSERTAVRERLDALESQLKAARYDTGEVERRVVELEDKVKAMRDEMAKERRELRYDMAAVDQRLRNEGRDLRQVVERHGDRTNADLHKVKEALHTILGAQLGPDAARDVLREAHARQDDDTEG